MNLTRTDRAWLIALLNAYDYKEIEIKMGRGYTRDLDPIESQLKLFLKKELFEDGQ
jgi:hypothetical protein